MRSSTFRWPRWWHPVGVALFLLCLGGLPFVVPYITFLPAFARNAMVLAAIGLPFAWALLVCPWLDSAVGDFTDRDPPSSRRKHMIVFAWTPFAIVMVLVAGLLITSIIQSWPVRRLVVVDELSAWWLWVIVAVSAMHGRLFGRLLASRTARAARRARVCFNCAYSLAEIPNCQRCPECGTEVGPRHAQAGGPS